MPRQINEAGLAMIKSFEGLRLDAYRDPVGIWTIGYGHIRGVQPGMTITEPQATDFLRQDLAAAEGFLNPLWPAVRKADDSPASPAVIMFDM